MLRGSDFADRHPAMLSQDDSLVLFLATEVELAPDTAHEEIPRHLIEQDAVPGTPAPGGEGDR